MNSEQPIIVIKKKPKGHAHHGGAWKVAYADFVTAMMAFFLVMWILGLNQETRKSIAAYFTDPSGMMKSHAGGNNVISLERNTPPAKRAITNGREALLKFTRDREALAKAKTEIEEKIAGIPKLKPFHKNIEVTLTREGLRIELLEDKKPLFFESGSANLRPFTVELLRLIGPELAKLPNNIIVEGHTDARPYGGGTSGYTNWNLSSDRANAARAALEPTLSHGQLKEVRGYGSTRLRNPDDPYHYSNRRISVLVPSTGYIEGVPMKEADEQGLIELKPGGPNLESEFLSQAQEAAKGAGDKKQ